VIEGGRAILARTPDLLDLVTGSRLDAPVDTDYRMREFALVDPSGNLIRVGSPPFI
jgi:hypothetical protein